jgi:3-hydroxyacyl-CoA dehydrogenase
MNFEKAAVIGSGTMGCGIAQVLSQAGVEVFLKDVDQFLVQKGLMSIKRMYDSRVRKETLTQEEADKAYALIKGDTSDAGLDEVDLVIEAALEKIEVKLEIFRKLDKLCSPHTILASNTSALSISEIAAATRRPDKVLGTHFFNPAQVMKLVEIIPGVATSQKTVDSMRQFCRSLGKMPVQVTECPGFLINRVLFPYINEALYVVQEGQFDPADVDQAALDFGLPMGPLALLDLTGLDICMNANQFLHDEYGVRFETAPVLPRLVKHGCLGQKSGLGIYIHVPGQPAAKGEKKELNPKLATVLNDLQTEGLIPKQKSHSDKPFDVYRVILPMFNEALQAIQENVVAIKDIDVALEHGIGLKRGLLTIAQEKGFAWCHEKLEQYRIAKGERFRPCWYLSKLVRGKVHDFRELGSVPVSVK